MADANAAGAAVDRLFGALARGDVAGAAAVLTPDARVWHSYDGIAHDVAGIVAQWEGLVQSCEERFITDIQCQPTAQGCVQQHLFVIRPTGGARKAWPVCVVVTVEGDRIARLDEYIDRAGSFAPGDGDALATPGLDGRAD